MRKSTAKVAFLLSIFLSGAAGLFALPASAAQEGPLGEKCLEDVHLKAASIGELLSRLAFDYEIPIGLETVNVEEPEEIYRVDFKRVTLRDLLDQVVADHEGYAWKIQDGVVNVFPKERRDPLVAQILSTEIDKLTIQENTGCWSFAQALFSTPEIASALGGTNFDPGSPGGFYIQQLGRKFAIDFTRTTTRSILNQVVKDSPVARFWMIGRLQSHGITYLRIVAGFEN